MIPDTPEQGARPGHLAVCAQHPHEGRLFDLSTDPGEQKDMGDSAPVALRLASIHLGEGLAISPKWARLRGGVAGERRKAVDAELSGEIKRQLEALGYAH